ncbi:MAG TPA: hypothetical protein VLC08_01025, partial [Chitinolyticbacter sp.]|nr:hypothetical protein [Chitinolyticbacter sp.]
PCTIEVDRELLGGALANLIEIVLRYGAGRIDVDVIAAPRHIALSVRDYGAELTEDEMPRVTDPSCGWDRAVTRPAAVWV